MVESKRLYSLDVLRGFDMFWIMGAEQVFHQMSKVTNAPFWNFLSQQFTHAEWHGFTPYDLIFPLFLFLAGVSTPFSMTRQLEKGAEKNKILIKVLRRTILLILLGIVYNNGLVLKPIEELRIASVLGRIGSAYFFATLIYLYSSRRAQMLWCGGILVGYWMLLTFTSAPGHAMGDFSMEGNFASYLDTLIMPGILYLKIHDPEGIISTLPAISTALLGIFTGDFLLKTAVDQQKRSSLKLAGIGLILILLSLLWDLVFPINKNLWTSSFTLLCGGISMILMSTFYYLVDILKFRRWGFFFKVIGMNSILIYLSGTFISWSYSTNALFGWLDQLVGAPFNSVIMVFCYLAVQWLFLYVLYRQKIFLKV